MKFRLRQDCFERRFQRFFVSGLTLPDSRHLPPLSPQSILLYEVPFHVAATLCSPKLRPRGRKNATPAAIVAVPETAVHKQCETVFGKNNVRFAGKVFSMEPEAKSPSVKSRTHPKLRLRVFTLDCRHIATALF
jgi:hypothetical protein